MAKTKQRKSKPTPPPPEDAPRTPEVRPDLSQSQLAVEALPFVNSPQYAIALGAASADEYGEIIEASKRVCADIQEWEESCIKESHKSTFSRSEAFKFALDYFGRRGLDVETWEAFKADDMWLLRDRANTEKGFVAIRDRWTISVLEKGIPQPIYLEMKKWEMQFARTKTQDKSNIIPANCAPKPKCEIQSDIQLRDFQKLILIELKKGTHSSYEGKRFKSIFGVSIKTVDRAFNGYKTMKGLYEYGLVTHTKEDGYRLTDYGRAFTETLLNIHPNVS